MDDGRKKTGKPRIYGEDDNYERELAHRRQIKIQKQVQEEKEKQEKQLEEEQPAQQDSLFKISGAAEAPECTAGSRPVYGD